MSNAHKTYSSQLSRAQGSSRWRTDSRSGILCAPTAGTERREKRNGQAQDSTGRRAMMAQIDRIADLEAQAVSALGSARASL